LFLFIALTSGKLDVEFGRPSRHFSPFDPEMNFLIVQPHEESLLTVSGGG
jgi:hypothetical protein